MKITDVLLGQKEIIIFALIYGIGVALSFGAFHIFVSAVPLNAASLDKGVYYNSPHQKQDTKKNPDTMPPNIPYMNSRSRAASSSQQMSCIQAGSIKSYHIHDDKTVEFYLKQNQRVFVKVQSCQDLFFHQYAGFVPTNGQLCISRDSLVTREGYSCPIQNIFMAKPKPGVP